MPEGVIVETNMDGDRLVRVPTEKGVESIRLPPEKLPRFACKMATGSGKTLVMALVIVWSYFHARREANSPMATSFLVVAPNGNDVERRAGAGGSWAQEFRGTKGGPDPCLRPTRRPRIGTRPGQRCSRTSPVAQLGRTPPPQPAQVPV